MFSKKATKIDEIFTVDLTLCSVKSTVKISSFFVAFLENMNFIFLNFNQLPAAKKDSKNEHPYER